MSTGLRALTPMLQQQKNRVPLAIGAGVFVLLIGLPLLAIKSVSWLEELTSEDAQTEISLKTPKSDVFSLATLPPEQRAERLQKLARQTRSPERDRARYLLASDLIQQQQGEAALPALANLEQDYPALAAPIVFKRAQAYELIGDRSAALATWQDLLKKYPDSPVAAEALYALGKTTPKYWQQAIAKFPSHPRSIEIARSLLQQNPRQPELRLLLAQHADIEPGIVANLDQLIKQSAGQLQPTDWEIVANAYWANQVYEKAATAYAQAPPTPRNLYRNGRSLQLNQKRPQAIAAYQQLQQQFPQAEETALALMQLARLKKPPESLTYLDRVIARFPKQAAEALAAKATILDTRDKKAAAQARQLLITKYGDAEAAAEYRWQVAKAKAAAKDYRSAWQWAEAIPARNPKSILAPRAAFWIGKWAEQLKRQPDAQAAYKFVLSQFPQSYYAWRSAVLLGLDVGNFNSLRQLNPAVKPPERSPLIAGSETLKELYQLGQDRDAWSWWQVEFQNRAQPTVAEQYTNGLIQLARGKNLVGINTISTLEDRELPAEQAEYQALSQQLAYWQARYPFPFLAEIETWSQQRQLNPLLVTSLIRQESRFEPNIRSVAGAVGLMQVMPATGKWVAEKSNLPQYNLENPVDNILMGTWYLDYTHQQYGNNSLLAVASYNAGPGNVAKWQRNLGMKDEDEFVEAIPFDETRGYVRQVFGNYWNYLRLYNPEISLLVGKHSVRSPKLIPD